MSIQRLQAQLERLNGKIEKCQSQLMDLKTQQREIKTCLTEAKKAAKRGDPPPPEPESEGLVKTIAATVSEAVVDPLTRLMGVGSEKSRQKGRPGTAEKARQDQRNGSDRAITPRLSRGNASP